MVRFQNISGKTIHLQNRELPNGGDFEVGDNNLDTNVLAAYNAGLIQVIFGNLPSDHAARANSDLENEPLIKAMLTRLDGLDGSGDGIADHGSLSGLSDDDHTQYLLANGTRAMSGALNLNGNTINGAGQLSSGLNITTFLNVGPIGGIADSAGEFAVGISNSRSRLVFDPIAVGGTNPRLSIFSNTGGEQVRLGGESGSGEVNYIAGSPLAVGAAAMVGSETFRAAGGARIDSWLEVKAFGVTGTAGDLVVGISPTGKRLFYDTANSILSLFASVNQETMRLSYEVSGVSYLNAGPVYFNNGTAALPSVSFFSKRDMGFWAYSAVNAIGLSVNGAMQQLFGANYHAFASNGRLVFCSGGADTTQDVRVGRGGAGILELADGANAQELRVFNTTNGTDKEFGKLEWASNVFNIGTEKVAGGTARALAFVTNDVERARILSDKPVLVMDEADADPAVGDLDANDSIAIYSKNNKLVFAYNNAGTITYVTIALDGAATTWTHSTTAP